MGYSTITPTELHRLCDQHGNVELIDVRTPVEFREVHATMARNVPLDRLNPQALMDDPAGDKREPLYVICKGGMRGGKACEQLVAAGFDNVVNVEGGTSAWVAAGLPVRRGKKAVSLERQVRIAAGLLICTGAALGYFIHPNWIGLSAFVGAGLTFAGITDTCAMGMLMAKMPWNQVTCNESEANACQA
ncbi:MAG: rhodanese-like domain-containing protein [Planctomycetota bacterium]